MYLPNGYVGMEFPGYFPTSHFVYVLPAGVECCERVYLEIGLPARM